MFEHVDLTGMNKMQMLDAPIVSESADVERLFRESESQSLSMSIAGMRHSQGGHTAVADGRMLITETFNRVHVPLGSSADKPPDTVDVDAGATWSEIQRRVCNFRRTPRVQQSSAHFSVGGSLSVNCHGREVRWGPVSDTVEEITVLTGAGGKPIPASPSKNPELFRAAIGGYGACGMILSARLKLVPNFMLYRGWNIRTLAQYQNEIEGIHRLPVGNEFRPKAGRLHLHHGWVNASEEGYLGQVISYAVKEDQQTATNENGSVSWASRLKTEGWGTSELLRAGWAISRIEPSFRKTVWDRLASRAKSSSGIPFARVDLLREDILFTSSKGDADGVDLLQEYFVPIGQLEYFIGQLRRIFPYRDSKSDVALLSCTVRYVRAETVNPAPLLSYCRDNQAMAGVAIDAYVRRGSDGEPTQRAVEQFRQAIEAALGLKGTFYLPYHRFATVDHFKQGYPDWKEWRDVVKQYNPSRRFHNAFLDHLGLF